MHAGEYVAETGLYYLNSRYYDPQTGRFLNADALLGANGDILSYNLFAYCSNNPVMGYDPSGYGWWSDFWSGVGDKLSDIGDAIAGFCGNITKDYRTEDAIKPDAVTSAAPMVSPLGSVFIDLGKGYVARIDEPHVKGDQSHVHIELNGSEVANQNEDGTPHHPNKNKPGQPPNSIKKKLKKSGKWDWDGNAAKQFTVDPNDLAERYYGMFPGGLLPVPEYGIFPSPAPAPAPAPVPWGIPVFG